MATLSKNSKCKARYSAELENFKRRLTQARNNRYRLGVIGVTSSGKSTMINALLGEKLLPAAARPSSSQLVSCYKDEERKATIYFENDSTKVLSGKKLNPEAIESYGDESHNSKNKEKVKLIELATPNFPFSNHIILVDSPGLDAYGFAGHEQLTMNSLLPTIDFCIFVTTCKTNSDEKMLTVLNAVADYEKPIIIVQNMIDSIKPSIDGKKTIHDVAQDHKNRVQRIIDKSKILEKSSVRIVQISAKNALSARILGNATSENLLLQSSNYPLLVSCVESVFESLRPRVEASRKKLLKKEIERIANNALQDIDRSLVSGALEFEYDSTVSEFENAKDYTISKLNGILRKFETFEDKINRYNFSQSDVNKLIAATDDVEGAICREMQKLNQTITSLCNQLNVDSRNIISDFRFEKPNLELRMTTKVNPHGKWIEGTRKWYTLWLAKTGGHWEATTETIIDVDGSTENARRYISRSRQAFERTISRWQKSMEVTEEKLIREIDNRRQEFEQRRNIALDAQLYAQIGQELMALSAQISDGISQKSSSSFQKTDVEAPTMHQITAPCYFHSISCLSEKLRLKLHSSILESFKKNAESDIIVGWDDKCEEKIAKYFFNKDIINLSGKFYPHDKIHLLHKPTKSSIPHSHVARNLFVLVNATQFGAALSEIDGLKLNEFGLNDHIYFVIQDFQETINGESVTETLENMKSIPSVLNLLQDSHILILHDNPIYNLVAVEAQTLKRCTMQDEINIIKNLQNRFPFLFPSEGSKKREMETIIDIIIQKLADI